MHYSFKVHKRFLLDSFFQLFFYNCYCYQNGFLFVAVTGGSSVSTSVSSHNKQSSSHTSLATSPIPTYISDFEDNTIPTATGPPLGVSMATTVGSSDSHGDTKKDAVVTVTDHVSEDISSEGDTLVEQHNNSQLDSTTLKDGECLSRG